MLIIDLILELYKHLPYSLVVKVTPNGEIVSNKAPQFQEVSYVFRPDVRDILDEYIKEITQYKIDYRAHTLDNLRNNEIPKLPSGYYFAPTPSMRRLQNIIDLALLLDEKGYFFHDTHKFLAKLRDELRPRLL